MTELEVCCAPFMNGGYNDEACFRIGEKFVVPRL